MLEEEISIRNLVELFNEVSMIEEGAKNRNRKAIYKWYKYAKSFGKKMEEEFEKDLEMVERVDSTIRKRIYDEMMGMMGSMSLMGWMGRGIMMKGRPGTVRATRAIGSA